MPREEFFILTTPDCQPGNRPLRASPIHLAFCASPQLRLLRLRGAERLRGGLMAVSGPSTLSSGHVDAFCADLLRTCAAQGFRGVMLNFDTRSPLLSRAALRLGQLLAPRRMPLFLPESYAPLVPTARVLVSSALSGGSLELRLRQALDRFGPDRVVLAVEKTAEDFPLPAPSGCGTPLTPEALERLRAETCPRDFFSPALCARYFLYRTQAGQVRFVLFDDADSLRRKVETARRAGVRAFLLPWPEVRRAPENFGLLP